VRGIAAALEHRNLAAGVARPQEVDHLFPSVGAEAADLHGAGDDDVKPHGGLVLAKDKVAVGIDARRRHARQGAQVLGRERREERTGA